MRELQTVHYEATVGRTACGRALDGRVHATDNQGEIMDREGSRCKACWRAMTNPHRAANPGKYNW